MNKLNNLNNEKISLKYNLLTLGLLLCLGLSFLIIYKSRSDGIRFHMKIGGYLNKVRNYIIYFDKKIKIDSSKKLFFDELKENQREVSIFINNSFFLKFKFKKNVEVIFKEPYYNQDELLHDLTSELISFEQKITVLMLFNFLFLIMIPLIFYFKYKNRKVSFYRFKDITYYDLSIKSIVLDHAFLGALGIQNEFSVIEVTKEINRQLSNLFELFESGSKIFSISISISKNFHSKEKAIFKFKIAGFFDQKILFSIEDSTNNIKKLENEIEYFEENYSPSLILNNRRIVAVNHQFEEFIGKPKESLIGSYFDHYSLKKTELTLKNERKKWELNLILDNEFNRKIVFSSISPYFWNGEEKHIFSAYKIIESNKEFDAILSNQRINLKNHNLEILFTLILDQNSFEMANYLGATKESLLLHDIPNLLSIVNNLEHNIFQKDWENAMLNFLKYAIRIEEVDEQILEAC